jgi:hypothetical protein
MFTISSIKRYSYGGNLNSPAPMRKLRLKRDSFSVFVIVKCMTRILEETVKTVRYSVKCTGSYRYLAFSNEQNDNKRC